MVFPPAKPSYAQPVGSAPTGHDCAHLTTKPVRHVVKNGAVHYQIQCLRCGDALRHIPKLERLTLSPSDIGEWDQSIRDRWWQYINAERIQHITEVYKQRREAWLEEASDYYSTPQWRRKSAAVLDRDKICQACLSRPATEAHHLTYSHWMQEPLFDLVGVCHECHEKITFIDRERRAR